MVSCLDGVKMCRAEFFVARFYSTWLIQIESANRLVFFEGPRPDFQALEDVVGGLSKSLSSGGTAADVSDQHVGSPRTPYTKHLTAHNRSFILLTGTSAFRFPRVQKIWRPVHGISP